MATTKRPTETELTGEQLDQAARRAEDALAKMPEPVAAQVASSFEQNAEADEQTQKAEEILNDKHASSLVMRQLTAMQEQLNLHHQMLMQALGKGGFAPLEREQEQPIVTAPHVPLDAIISIYIPEGMTPQEREAIPVGVNGEVRWIPRGSYVQVTKAELEVLQNAVFEGQELPAKNDVPLARKVSSEHMTLSQPIPYRHQRYPIMVHSLPFQG